MPGVVHEGLVALSVTHCYNRLTMEEVIPERLMKAEELGFFLAWLRLTRLDPEDKRQLLTTWADRVGVKINENITERAGIG